MFRVRSERVGEQRRAQKQNFDAVLPVESFAEMGREDTGEFSTGLVRRAGAQDLLVMLCTINLNKQLL